VDFFLSTTKWSWVDGDGSEDILQWFGFTNLNPKPFCHCYQDAMMMIVDLA
jgi:hypothetical protein